jgi:hypothetical protein
VLDPARRDTVGVLEQPRRLPRPCPRSLPANARAIETRSTGSCRRRQRLATNGARSFAAQRKNAQLSRGWLAESFPVRGRAGAEPSPRGDQRTWYVLFVSRSSAAAAPCPECRIAPRLLARTPARGSDDKARPRSLAASLRASRRARKPAASHGSVWEVEAVFTRHRWPPRSQAVPHGRPGLLRRRDRRGTPAARTGTPRRVRGR